MNLADYMQVSKILLQPVTLGASGFSPPVFKIYVKKTVHVDDLWPHAGWTTQQLIIFRYLVPCT